MLTKIIWMSTALPVLAVAALALLPSGGFTERPALTAGQGTVAAQAATANATLLAQYNPCDPKKRNCR